MNWLLGIAVVGLLLIAAELFRRQLKADRDFMDFMLRNGYPVGRKEDE